MIFITHLKNLDDSRIDINKNYDLVDIVFYLMDYTIGCGLMVTTVE